MRIVPEERCKVQPGQKFNRWTVIGKPFWCPCGGKCGKSKQFAVFQCECGSVTAAFVYNMTRGLSKSCGCHASEATTKRNWKHGETHTRLHVIWRSMIQRCGDPNCEAYKKWYGSRGITVCDEWKADFTAFRDWAISSGYEDGLSLDRERNNEGYSPDNCRWATRIVQANNTRANRIVDAFGERKTAAEWAKDQRCVVKYGTLLGRLRSGWRAEMAIASPVDVTCHAKRA